METKSGTQGLKSAWLVREIGTPLSDMWGVLGENVSGFTGDELFKRRALAGKAGCKLVGFAAV